MMVHLQARRNLEMFLRKAGLRSFTPEEKMSFQLADHRLDLFFGAGMLHMTVSIREAWVSDARCLTLMTRAGTCRQDTVLRIYRLPDELGINGVVADTASAEQWFRLYQLQLTLLRTSLHQPF